MVDPRTIVVGGGTAGLASARALGMAGHRVTVLERFGHVHDRGSHSGHTRVIRHAYHEGEFYVDLVRRADAAWVALERGRFGQLLRRCGLLEFGAQDDPAYQAAGDALRHAGLPHERMDAARARAQWPFTIPDDWEATSSPDGGYLRVQACLDALRDDATAHGVEFRYGVRVREIDYGGRSPRVLVEAGDVLATDHVVVAAGAFATQLMPWLRTTDGRQPIRPQRRVLFWRRPRAEHVAVLSALPVWGAFVPEGFFYGFPHNDAGVTGLKLACHHARDPDALPSYDEAVNPELLRREVDDRDAGPVDAFVARYLPIAGEPHASSVCMYAATMSGDFLIDRLPDDPRVVVVGGLSGHGFKFAPVLGELVVDALAGRDTQVPAPFRLARHRGWGG